MTIASAESDSPGVIAPAPGIFVSTLVAGILVDTFARIGVIGSIPRPLRASIAISLILIGVFILARGIQYFRRIKTTILPYFPSSVLAVGNIYSRTRNPMYQGMVTLVLGFGVLMRSDWTILLLIPSVLIVHYGVVMREERYLEKKFGAEYRRYKKEVPRYGWRLLYADNLRKAFRSSTKPERPQCGSVSVE
jgi:protein-S-isoprenylcysteine O-methyltransferase Ste14